ncbi:MAG: sigma-70 family RNA polymerase sigma factor [Bryobacteraceae bacterium]
MNEPLAAFRSNLTREAEARLIRQLQDRNPNAYEQLYDSYSRLIYSVTLRIVQDASVAEDIVQEAFLRVWNCAHLFDCERGAFGPWLLAIARNRALDFLRTSKNLRNAGPKVYGIEDPNAFADVDRSGSMPDKISVRTALRKLGGNQRVAIDLAYFEGYSQSEIAAKLGHPLGTVKTWMRSALRTLRGELRDVSGSQQAVEAERSWSDFD